MKYLTAILLFVFCSCIARKSDYTTTVDRDYLGLVKREVRTYNKAAFFNGVSFPKGTKVVIEYKTLHISIQ